MIDEILLLLLLLWVLAYSAEWVIKALVELGRRFRISEFILGFVIMGIATSLPEISVAINSVIDGNPGLSIGNLLGASLVLLSLIVGLAAVLQKGIPIGHFLKSRDLAIGSALIAAPIFVLVDGELSFIDGWWLVVLYTGYLWYLYIYRVEIALRKLHKERYKLWQLMLGGALGLGGLMTAAYYIVHISLKLAGELNMPPLIIGVLILGIGTNLPEIVLTIKARKTGAQKLVLGDLLGSAAANTLIVGVIGTSGTFQLADHSVVLVAGVFLCSIVLLFNIFIRTKHSLSPSEGFILLLAYLMFVALQIFF